MVTIEQFYDNFLLHHHRAKAVYIRRLLEDREWLQLPEIAGEHYGFNRDQYDLSLRMEARSNLFHAIETLFTLYFCLLPGKDGTVRDDLLFYAISKKVHYNAQIRAVADDPKTLDILDTTVIFNERDISLGQHIFYYALKKQEHFDVHQSVQAIKQALHILANEISDTSEYNSYKHSLKAVSFIKEFALADQKTKEVLLKLDASNSMTYFQDLKEGEFQFTTKVLDTKRDIALTELASNLIYQVIGFRKVAICGAKQKVAVGEFSIEGVDKCATRYTQVAHFTMNHKPDRKK